MCGVLLLVQWVLNKYTSLEGIKLKRYILIFERRCLATDKRMHFDWKGSDKVALNIINNGGKCNTLFWYNSIKNWSWLNANDDYNILLQLTQHVQLREIECWSVWLLMPTFIHFSVCIAFLFLKKIRNHFCSFFCVFLFLACFQYFETVILSVSIMNNGRRRFSVFMSICKVESASERRY